MRLLSRLILLAFLLPLLAGRGMADVTVKATIDPPEANVGDEVTVTYTLQGGSAGEVQLPAVEGLNPEGSSTSSQFVMNGFTVTQSFSQAFTVVPVRPGNFTIPSFGIHTESGQIIHTQPLKLHVTGSAGMATTNVPVPSANAASLPPANGPVVLPPDSNGQNPPPSNDASADNSTISVPTGPDGRPARVFHLITPKTTDAYVGESIPLTIQFYIRADSNAQQNSLPTLVGSDFLMNNLSLRPMQDGVGIANEEYIRNTWITAISAPRPGDFLLEATRDTYWAEGQNYNNDPFGALFGRNARLMHKEIGSNKIIIHVHPLPDEGKPANFTGAIGKFQVAATAEPGTVGVGEPVSVRFTVNGEGNFDYVRAPSLAPDPAWKSYVPTAKTDYEGDDSHTQAIKTFEQAIIPQKNGVLALPAASFSYFDPDTKHYITVPVPLPSIVVTGSMPAVAAASAPAGRADEAGASLIHTPAPTDFAPNQLTFGVLTPSLAPLYRHPGFWIAQAALGGAVLLGLLAGLVPRGRDPARIERAERDASLQQEEAAIARAVHAGDAPAFFSAARRSVQLQLAGRWHAAPEALTLSEIYQRDPALAETVAPLFNEADDVIYSGQAPSGLDLAEWDRRVRGMLQPARL